LPVRIQYPDTPGAFYHKQAVIPGIRNVCGLRQIVIDQFQTENGLCLKAKANGGQQ
jgi:hypothetical protein